MKINPIFKSFLSFFILFLLFSVQAYAQSWDGGPNRAEADWRDFFLNFNATESDDRRGAESSTIKAIDATTWTIRKPDGRKRAEASRADGWAPKDGSKYYISWSWRIRSTPNLNTGIAVFQWKTDDGGNINTSKQNYPFNMGYNGRKLLLNAYGPGDPNWTAGSVSSRKKTIWDGNVSENSWVDIVIGVKVSKDASQGTLELWINGKLQTLKTGGTLYKHRTNDGKVVYPKWGAYNGASIPFDVSVDVKNLKITQTRP